MGNFLTDISFLDPGRTFPPASEVERITDYRDNIMLFNGDTYDVFKHFYPDANRRVKRILDDYADIISYPVDINYHRILATGVQDLVCGERPIITVPDSKKDTLRDIESDCNLYERLGELVLDMPRLGSSAARVYKLDNKPRLQIMQLSNLYKVVSPEDKNEVINYVIAEPKALPDSTEKKPKWELHIQIHYKGHYIKRVHRLDVVPKQNITTPVKRVITNIQLFEIQEQTIPDEIVPTGLSDFAIVSAHNLMTSDTCWGHDEYGPMDPILAEIWARLGQVAIILDKHSRPDFSADVSSCEQNRIGQWKIKTGMGNVFPVPPGGTVPQYITWDGQLVACFNELDRLFEQLYKVTEMGPIFEAASGQANIAYETIKAQMARPLSKASRISTAMTAPLKKLIALLSEFEGQKIEIDEISVEWQDGLPNDEKQEIEKAKLKCDAGLSTPKRENIARFGKNEEQAEEIDEDVRTYQSERAANSFGGFGGGGFGDEE